ncbi:MAG: glycosyltransferase [Ignavibacteria bacterium]
MKLAIISHTPHYKNKNNSEITGWGPTVREINHMTELFEEIYHIAPLHIGKSPASSMAYESDHIKFIPLNPYGGEKLSDKISIITTAAGNLKIIKDILKLVDWVQFRAPTAMGIYVLPYLSLLNKPKRWVKYAGNWKMENPPLSYSFQKWWLNNNFQHSKVTINGQWEGQKKHILNFQNPCLDNEELSRAKKIAVTKNFEGKLTLCFVGTLTENKGVHLLLEALKKIKNPEDINEVLLIGDGEEKKKYEAIAKEINLKIIFKGLLKRNELEEIYKASHLIILPSESEGFPKVIAEASAYGCVPIVSDVSSVGQYYNDMNGFLLKKTDVETLVQKINSALSDRINLKKMSAQCIKVAELFTFENYIKNLKEKILCNDNIDKI